MKNLRLLIALLLLGGTLHPKPLFADFNAAARGTAAGSFLQLGSGARNAALGEAATALGDDPSALFINPAGLTAAPRPAATFSHALGFESSFIDAGAGLWPVGKRSAMGAGIIYSGQGSVLETDDTAVEHGSFSPNDQAGMLGGAHDFGILSVGANIKYIRSTILATAQTAAMDVGVMTPRYWNERLRFGLSALNMGGKLKYEQDSEPLPFALRGGTAVRPTPRLLLTLDGNFPRSNAAYLSSGVEWTLAQSRETSVALRAGYNGGHGRDLNSAAISGGAGIKLGRLGLDYAFVPYGDLGDTHQISLTFKFDRPAKPQPKEPESPPIEVAIPDDIPVVAPKPKVSRPAVKPAPTSKKKPVFIKAPAPKKKTSK